MKKLYSLAAFGGLFYTMPMNANYYFGTACAHEYNFALNEYAMLFFQIVVIILLQTLILRYFLRELSYSKALLTICVGNIPSTLLAVIFPNLIQFHLRIAQTGGLLLPWEIIIGVSSLTLSNTLIMLTTIALLFHYPIKRLVTPLLLGNFATYLTLAIWMLWIFANVGCR
jgi:hypothetical protein